MFGKLFGSGSEVKSTGAAERVQPKSSDFDLGSEAEKSEEFNVPHDGEEIERHVYVLGAQNCKFLEDDMDILKKLPPISEIRRSGYSVHLNVHYIEEFKLYPNINVNRIMTAWGAVMDVFKEAADEDVDDIILVGACYTNILESRRIFLEKVREKIGEDSDRYEHIRSCLEFYSPINKQKEFFRWARI